MRAKSLRLSALPFLLEPDDDFVEVEAGAEDEDVFESAEDDVVDVDVRVECVEVDECVDVVGSGVHVQAGVELDVVDGFGLGVHAGGE